MNFASPSRRAHQSRIVRPEPDVIVRLFAFSALLCLTLIVSLSSATRAGDVTFRHVPIDDQGPLDMHSKTVGDVNGDGFADLIVTGTQGGVVWYEYPRWKKHVISQGEGGWSTDVEVGDVNRDGRADLVVSDWYRHERIGWFENTGGGDDTWVFHVIGKPRAHDIELADLNADGRLDLVTRTQGDDGNKIELWLQTADNEWHHRTLSCPAGEGLVATDLDRDGDKDVVIGNIWLETPADPLQDQWASHVLTNQWQHEAAKVATGDVNGDRRIDVVIAPAEKRGQRYRVAWYEAPADPKSKEWTEHVVDPDVECVLHSLELADVNNDGHPDVVSGEMHQGDDPDEVNIYLNQGDGTRWNKNTISRNGTHSLRVVDVGNDGDIDIFGANWRLTGQVDLWENLQAKPLDKWTYIELDDSRVGRAFGLAMAEMTGDDQLDIVSGKYFYGNPGKDLTSPWSRVTFPVDADALLTLNVDGDSHADVIAMNDEGSVYWLEATSSECKEWTATRVADLGKADHRLSSQGYTFGQIDGQGKPEIILSVADIYYLTIPDNPEAGNWPKTLIANAQSPEGVAAADIDGDGDVDLAGPADVDKLAWWDNPGDGSARWTKHEVGSLPDKYADRLYLADLNGSGRLDIAVCLANARTDVNGVYWFEHVDADAWTLHTITHQATTNSMDIADMDSDGDIDIISGEHRGDKRVAIWENDGHGQFAEHVISTGIESHLGTRVADIDSDGDLDIVSIAWDDAKDLHLWRNDAVSWTGPRGRFILFDDVVTHGGDKRLHEDWDFQLRMPNESDAHKNWLDPINFADGTYHLRLEILEMKPTEKPVLFGIGWVNLPRADDPTIQHRVGWPIWFKKPGVYEATLPMQSMWHGPGKDTDPKLSWNWVNAFDDDSIFTIFRPYGQDPFPIKFRATLTIISKDSVGSVEN